MRILLTLLVFMAGCGGCATLPPSKPTYAAATRLEFPSGGICSATAIGRHTLVSAAHCFTEPRGLVKVNATLAEYHIIADDKRDHVLVRVGSTQGSIAKFGRPAKWGQMLSIIGNPIGFYSLLRMGRVAGWENEFSCPDGSMGCKVMLTNLNTVGGDSGSGYFNARGEVVGVHSGSVGQGIWKLAYSYPLAFTGEQLAMVQ